MCNGNLFRKVPKLGEDPHTNEFADTNFTRFLNNSPTIHSILVRIKKKRSFTQE